NAYIGMFYVNGYLSNERGYEQIKLKDSLKKDKYYYAEYFVNVGQGSQYGCNNIAMLFTKTAVYVDTAHFPYGVLPANPQIVNYGNPVICDTQNWVKVSGIFKADGGEQYLTLGNFKRDSQTLFKAFQPSGYYGAGYNIDDVSVIPLDSFCLKADAGNDTAITLGDSVFIGSYTNGIDSLKWLSGNTIIDSLRPGFWVKPTTTTTYILQQTVNGCFSADTVVVTVGTVPLKFLKYEVRSTNKISNENNEKQVTNNWVTTNEVNVSHFNIQRSINGKDFTSIGTVKANNIAYNEYSFTDPLTTNHLPFTIYYRIESFDKDGKKQYSTTQQITINPQTTNKVFVYPNPSRDIVNVVGDNIQQIIISTIEGKKVLSSTQKQVSIASLAKGVYIIGIFTTNGSIKNEKLIVQ
ncbi:MAG: T9SS type A sorting domain-containing protein, partial [Chitinophagaceae bacterium]